MNNNDMNNFNYNRMYNNVPQQPVQQPVYNQQSQQQTMVQQPVYNQQSQQQTMVQQPVYNQPPQQPLPMTPPPKKSKKILIILILLIVAGLVGGGIFLLNSSDKEEDTTKNETSNKDNPDTTEKDEDVEEDEENSPSVKYVYASSLSEQEKTKIIEENKGKYTLVETIDINQNIKDIYSYDTDSRYKYLFINKVMKFKDSKSSSGIVVLDYVLYGNTGTYSSYFLNRPLVNVSGDALDSDCVFVNSGYHCLGSPFGLPIEYNVLGDYNFYLGFEDKSNNKVYDTKISGYWYYHVDEIDKVDLTNLFLYYQSEDVEKNIFTISNSDYGYTYNRIQLVKSNDSIPDKIYTAFAVNKNTTKTIKYYQPNDTSQYGKLGYYIADYDTRYDFDTTLSISFDEYRIEKWSDKNVLIVPYTINKITDDERYLKYGEKAIKVKLIDKDGKALEPINLNKQIDDSLFDLTKDTKMEAVYILPDEFDVNSSYLGFAVGLSDRVGNKSEYAIPVSNLSEVQ